jgi:ATP-dependent helicase HrpA
LRALARALRHAFGDKREALQAARDDLLARSRAAVALRQARLPRPRFANDLPVNARREEIAALIERHQVVIVCGETGSGKTTQLPQICLALGRGAAGLIGHTQPRRIAARTVAARIAEELGSEPGTLVGYKIRFTDRTSNQSCVKVMTDGILLAETQTDPLLAQYDTLILDEAHERSLNIDFLLGFLKQLLPKRPDLKVIVTSATIDAARFASHFHGAPVIEVSGRLYPVEVRYRLVRTDDDDDDERDLYDAIVDACDELHREGPGDVLVFLPGEREIREANEALLKHHPPHTAILPLYARLSASEQARIFEPHVGRRIVLTTNVAETSLTVPGIRYVVDTGLARVKRYSYRQKVEQLQIERIARAAANQRAGRCGRVAAGICIRLYDEADFLARPEFTDPEILRSSLAGVILRMKSLRLGEVDEFPFLEPPPVKAIGDGYQLLLELGAVTEARALTPLGTELATLPLDPKLGRMILAARDAHCLHELLVIAAALSVQDPRERPIDRQEAAEQAHRKFADERSEFVGWLKLWRWYEEQLAQQKSQRKLVTTCHEHFLSARRMREWRDIHSQLHALAAEHGWHDNDQPADYDEIHRALLSGLLGNVGCKAPEGAHYLGTRGIRFLIHPGSQLHKKAGRWIAAAEITETTRLYARCIAKIEPEWLEQVGGHLIRRSHYDPHWEKKAMRAVAFERTTLYGLVINPRRSVNFGPLDPKEARTIFIRDGLVAGEIAEDYVRRWAFFHHNRKLIADIEQLEHKSRRQDVLVDETLIEAFYDRLIPQDVCDGPGFDRWRQHAERDQAKLLYLDRADLMRHEAAGITTEAFPHRLEAAGVAFDLSYQFEPGSAEDGVTLTVPLARLNQVPAARCEWLVPGLLKEKVVQLVKTLPQRIRAKLVPVPDFAAEFVAAHAPADTPLIPALIKFIFDARGLNARGWAITPDAFRPEALPPHLLMNYKLLDEHGRQLAQGRNLAELRAGFAREARQEFAARHAIPAEHTRMTEWSCGPLPELLEVAVPGGTAIGYPGFIDEGDAVSLRVFDTQDEARAAHRAGLLRLFLLRFRDQVKYFDKHLPGLTQMGMQFMALGTIDELRRQLIDLIFSRACLAEPWPVDGTTFEARYVEAKNRVGLLAHEISRLVGQILADWHALKKKLAAFKAHAAAQRDLEQQLDRLIHQRFISDTPFERLQHFPRYLQAASLRLDKLKNDPARDARLLADYTPLWSQYQKRAAQLGKQGSADQRMQQYRWRLEELRVQLFAQELRTPTPVSVKRLRTMWDSL